MEEHGLLPRRWMTMASKKQWQTVSVALNPYVSLSMGELLDGWRSHVRRLSVELDAETSDRATWGAHDYAAALHIREAFERGLALLQAQDRADAKREVADSDQYLQTRTEPDVGGLLNELLSAEATSDSWWWHRVPKRGPVRDELESYKRR
ncbi:hypothetical protein [Nocardioides sp. 1609]|uniref:hypothetical protein n=1 Tax=Nocardioides sp. 1609 TaxID=2508327 RepID=UPI00106F5CEE|nr:hypothetical protein [Nocardioides sp. 1609]